MEKRKLVMRSDKVAFMKVGEVWHRMRGFKKLPTSKNPEEYTRKYVDEEGEITDVVGISETKEFEFDQYVNDPVHEFLANIIDNEILGSEAQAIIMTVDKNKKTDNAIVRTYSIIADTSGDGTEAYTYAGKFSALSKIKKTTATVEADGLTAEISAV